MTRVFFVRNYKHKLYIWDLSVANVKSCVNDCE